VFFSGCTLKCCYCQNYNISAEGFGKELTVEQLAAVFLDLQRQGAHNINLVTPGQWRPWIIAALDLARAQGLSLPIVCNTGGYETVESVEAWRGSIDIWLADLKYVSSALSQQLSAAPDYFAVAKAAIEAMLAQAGRPQFDENGLLRRGVIVRHLALPGHTEDSFAVLEQLAAWNNADPGCFLPSLMSQYTPFYKAAEHGIGRRITSYEYRRVVDRAMDLGLTTGYMQQKSSAKEEYTPSFDLTGLEIL
jgi:putative pyruvate formate lyase activating enzyme